MEFLLDCACGDRVRVTEGMCGASVPCACGRTIRVPSLGELRRSCPAVDGPPRAPRGRSAGASVALGLAVAVFAGAALALGFLATKAGGLAGFGYALALAGQLWLLVQIARVCAPDALALALFVPFFTWYYGVQRWDIAKWPLLCNVGGTVLMTAGLSLAP